MPPNAHVSRAGLETMVQAVGDNPPSAPMHPDRRLAVWGWAVLIRDDGSGNSRSYANRQGDGRSGGLTIRLLPRAGQAARRCAAWHAPQAVWESRVAFSSS